MVRALEQNPRVLPIKILARELERVLSLMPADRSPSPVHWIKAEKMELRVELTQELKGMRLQFHFFQPWRPVELRSTTIFSVIH